MITGVTGFIGNLFTLYLIIKHHVRKSIFYKLIFYLLCFDTIIILSFGSRITLLGFTVKSVTQFHERISYVFENFGMVGSV